MAYILVCNGESASSHKLVSRELPWMSIDASGNEMVIAAHLPFPTLSEVEKCMNCPFDECRDCIRKHKDSFKEPHRPPLYDVTFIRRLVDEGKSSREISETVGCAERTARRYIRRFTASA